MGADHTPGPWEVEGPLRPGPAYRIRSARGLVTYVGDPVTASYDAANARLIATAPTLLGALKIAQSALAMLTEPAAIRVTSTQQAWAQAVAAEAEARAAIAKAEGR